MVIVLVGTEKGAWALRSEDRAEWTARGPLHPGWKVTTFGRTGGGDWLLATGSSWYGAALHRSADLDAWEQIVDGPAYPEGGGRTLSQIWTLAEAGEDLYAGVDEAGLFRSRDDGAHWEPVAGLNEHPTRPAWTPGLGGLAAHRILADPSDPTRLWCAISAVGVFRSDDGGDTWAPVNRGVPVTAPAEEHDVGYCVHRIALDPQRPDTLWRQDHRGVFRSRDAGDSWERIEAGLPAGFGFPIVFEPQHRALFTVPLESDENRLPVGGALRVYRSTDEGDSWHPAGNGLPAEPTYSAVLRDAMDVDGSGGVVFGTTGGAVWFGEDGGERWSRLPGTYPRILSVKAFPG